MSYRSLWFKLSGAQTVGTVVSIAEEGTPSLVVEYHTESGQPLRTRSAGSDFYRGIGLDDRLVIYYDPRDPSDARLDLFVENWVLPLFVGFPGVVCLLACLIIMRN